MFVQTSLEGIDGQNTACCDCAIIHMDCDNDDHLTSLSVLVEDGLIDLALFKTKTAENLCELLVPLSPSLLEAVQRLAKAKNAPRGVLTIAGGVPHVEDFVGQELAIQVCSLDIDLVQFETKLVGHGDDGV